MQQQCWRSDMQFLLLLPFLCVLEFEASPLLLL
jgi:hypothetical protein